MAEHKITDFVDQSAIDGLRRLKEDMNSAKETYIAVAMELAKGLKVPIDNLEQLEKADRRLSELQAQAAQAAQKHSAALAEQERIVGATTNTISRHLMEQERINKTQREAYTEQEKVRKLLDQYNDTYENQVQSLVKINRQLEENKKAQKDNEKALSQGRVSMTQYTATQSALIARHRSLTQEKRTLTQLMTAEEKAAQSTEGSYVHMSQQLELLKKAYKELSEEGRNSDIGKEMDSAIQNLDAHLKDIAADMGEFQRNVGNYAIAGRNGVVSTESLTAALSQQAVTQKDLADQTKILEEARLMLNKNDANYQATLDAVNAKLEENRRKLMDVDDIMGKEARTVAEAEAQNKRLSEAIKHIDLTSSDAKDRLAQMRGQIERNNQTIAEATGQNEKFADSMLSLIGINGNFGSSLMKLESSGSFLEGMRDKTAAFGKTLKGLLANPWVLAFLGIAGVVAGFKWWYEYNKGLAEASRLTENFTGKTGEAADRVTADMQTLGDRMGKGYNQTIGAANTLVQQFGISWDEAYEKMRDGITAGADMSGNMLANIERFAPAMRDAGVTADEFMSILAETRNGIFNEDGIQNIVKAGTRLRAMTKKTEEALDGVGISARKMQQDLAEGNISMLDAVQQVAARLKELPENSQEAGEVIKNVFGRTASEGGTLLIQSIADINTGLDTAKENMGELGRVNEEQMEAQRELNETLMSVFKSSGTSFEVMTTQAKTFVTEGITKIIKGCVEIVNWFIRLYNKSIVVRTGFEAITGTFKTIWAVGKAMLSFLVDGFSALGDIIEGVLTFDIDKMKAGNMKAVNAIKDNFMTMFRDIKSAADDTMRNIRDGSMKEVSVGMGASVEEGMSGLVSAGGVKGFHKDGKGSNGSGDGKDSSKDAEKKANEELKLAQALEDSKIAIMEEGLEKELALIRQKYKKKMDAVKGHGETENALRLQIAEECSQEVAKCEEKFEMEAAKINLANRLATVKEGSEEELRLRLAHLESQRQEEVKKAEQTGADILLVNEKFEKEKLALREEYASKAAQQAMDDFAVEQSMADNAFAKELNKLKSKYAEELGEAQGNADKKEEITRTYEAAVARLTETYAIQRANSAVSMYEEILKNEDLSAKERMKIEDKLAKARMQAADATLDHNIAVNKKIDEDDKKAKEKLMDRVRQWLQVASDALNSINGLSSAIYDAKIQRIEEEQEANTEAGEAEQERIAELVENNVLTEEEGEARKRAAEERTAKREEELEKKKQQLQYKQAVWDKANQLAQSAIATATAIMRCWSDAGPFGGPVFAAIAGALGAVQMATIIATPIPKYAKGTKDHPGGLAVVGDGGRREVVSFGGEMFLTPDRPTLIDMPKGAEVFPDAERLIASSLDLTPMFAQESANPGVIVRSDAALFASLEKRLGGKLDEIGRLIQKQTKEQKRAAYNAEYEQFKIMRGL